VFTLFPYTTLFRLVPSFPFHERVPVYQTCFSRASGAANGPGSALTPR